MSAMPWPTDLAYAALASPSARVARIVAMSSDDSDDLLTVDSSGRLQWVPMSWVTSVHATADLAERTMAE